MIPPKAEALGFPHAVSMKEKDSAIEMQGKVTKILPGSMYRVQLDNGFEVLAHVAGRMRKFNIRIALGDRVSIEMSPYDLTKGRITYRQKTQG